jgi:hypothetical protein
VGCKAFYCKGHTRYCELLRGPHVKYNGKWYTQQP